MGSFQETYNDPQALTIKRQDRVEENKSVQNIFRLRITCCELC